MSRAVVSATPGPSSGARARRAAASSAKSAMIPLAALQASKADIKRVFRSKAEVSALLNGTQADGFPDDASSPAS